MEIVLINQAQGGGVNSVGSAGERMALALGTAKHFSHSISATIRNRVGNLARPKRDAVSGRKSSSDFKPDANLFAFLA